MTRIRIGILGLGFGRFILEELTDGPAAQLFEIAAVCDSIGEKARAAAAALGVAGYTELDDLLADETISAIGLFTGPVGRAALIRRIAAAGRHVMTTKPLELNADDALEALRYAKDHGYIVHLNSPSPIPTPDIKQILAWARDFDLGRPVGCRRDVWASYDEAVDGSWYDDPELCPAAPIFRLGIYLINDLVRLFGPAQRVSVLESRIRTARPTADNAQLGILFQNGVIANVYASFCIEDGDQYTNGIILNYEKGTIYGNVVNDPTKGRISKLSLVQQVGTMRAITAEAAFSARSGTYDWDLFARCIRGEKIEGEISPEEAVYGIRLIEAMKRASRDGGIAEVAP